MRSKVLEVERVQQGGGRGLSRLRSDSACERHAPEGRRGEVTVLVNGAYPRGGARVPRSGGARTPTLVCPRSVPPRFSRRGSTGAMLARDYEAEFPRYRLAGPPPHWHR